MNEYECVRKDYVGFAHFYLWRCDGEFKSDDEIDKDLFAQLLEIDTRLGTTATEQLYKGSSLTLNFDILKVLFHSKIKEIQIILVDKYGESQLWLCR